MPPSINWRDSALGTAQADTSGPARLRLHGVGGEGRALLDHQCGVDLPRAVEAHRADAADARGAGADCGDAGDRGVHRGGDPLEAEPRGPGVAGVKADRSELGTDTEGSYQLSVVSCQSKGSLQLTV